METDASFNVFYDTYRRRAIALAVALCGDSARAEEVVQEAFVSAFLAWRRVAEYDRPDAWLFRVVANRSISARRRARTESKLIDRLSSLREPSEGERVDPSKDALLIAQMVMTLPRRQAQCVALRYVDEQSPDEIATSLGISAATVRVHLHRARQTIVKAMQTRQTLHD